MNLFLHDLDGMLADTDADVFLLIPTHQTEK